MERKFDIIKPNLYAVGDRIYFSMRKSSDIIPACRSIDEIVKKNIGDLKVTEGNLEIIKSGKSKKTERKYSIPLSNYLDAIKIKVEFGMTSGITNKDAELFGLSYIVNAKTTEDILDVIVWEGLSKDLANPQKLFDERKGDKYNIYKLDREKTLENMKELHQELDKKIPDNCAELVVVNGCVPYDNDKAKTAESGFVGAIGFNQLKAKDNTKIEETKSQLIEKLKEVDGPCLSLDAPNILMQMINFYSNASEVVQEYGNILVNPPTWRTRLFILDP